jgi:hypothetical protein
MQNDYRKRAIECLQLANEANNPRHRARLLEMAQTWMRLHDQAEKNSQADLSYETPPPQRTVPQQLQMQQTRAKPEE